MIPILDSETIRAVDKFTIQQKNISSLELMEQAAAAFFDEILYHSETNIIQEHFSIFCGKGNNGGDALVIAKYMHLVGIQFKLYIVDFTNQPSADFSINLDRIQQMGIRPQTLNEEDYSFDLEVNTIVIDSIFGSGLNRPIEGFIAEIIHKINRANKIIAIDIPSGLMATDNSSNQLDNVIKASKTISFQIPKLAFLLSDYYQYVGDWKLIDIGLDKGFIQNQSTDYYFIELTDIQSRIKKRDKFSHKGTYGHTLLISGSYAKMGATVLAAKAALSSGVGLLTIHAPKCGVVILQTTVPQAMLIADENEKYLKDSVDYSTFSTVGIGPSIGKNEATANLLKQLFNNFSKPILLDADALNILSENKEWIKLIPSNSILTPHPGEFQRLVGKWKNDEEKLRLQINFSKENKLFVVLKGAYTSISCPNGKVYFNSTANAGMAMGGSGDILSGMITALLAQNYTPLDAAIVAVYIHGLAGDKAAEAKGQMAMIAEDIIENIAVAFKRVA